jgi:AraC-like DNA-binding protein
LRHALITGQFSPSPGTDSRAESMRPWGEVVQLERGPLGERLRWISIGSTRMCRFDFSRAVVVRGATDAPTLVVGQRGLRSGGWTLRDDEVLSLGAGGHFDLYVPASTSVAFVLGSPVNEDLGTLQGDGPELLHRSSGTKRAALWSCVNSQESTGARQKLEESLRRAIAASLAGSDGPAARAAIADGTRSRAVRGALEFIESRPHASLRLADLCAATGVGPRTIEYGFREFYDISPMTYVKYLRLNRARRDLIRAGPTASSVKRYAEVWGFRHMGQFAKDYKILFGENPSATLVRSQDRL